MSVTDLNAPKEAQDRESIELRMICLWKEADVDSTPTNENVNLARIQSSGENAIAMKGISLTSATFWQLIVALLTTLPLVGGIFAKLGATMSIATMASPARKYSGNPSDYEKEFIVFLGGFDSWPAFGKTWAKSQVEGLKTTKEGIAVMTKILVDDQAGYAKHPGLL